VAFFSPWRHHAVASTANMPVWAADTPAPEAAGYYDYHGNRYMLIGDELPSWSYRPIPDPREAQCRNGELIERIRRDQEQQRQSYDRSLKLLMAVLTPQQAKDYRNKRYFEVTGSSGRQWMIWAGGQVGNVFLQPSHRCYCAQPPGYLPDPDAHLAQMLAIRTDDRAFEQVAHRM
jgi:hypothetical protein